MPERHRRATEMAGAALRLLACLLLAAHAAQAQARLVGGGGPTVTAETREGRLRLFDEVWENIRARYYDPEMRGADWGAAREAFRPRAAEAGGAAEFYATLRRMVGRLRDPHTRVFAPGEASDWRVARSVTVGVGVREIGGELFVTSVEPDSEAERAGVRAGDPVVGLDGEPATALVARRLAELSAGPSASARLLAVARLFDGPRDTFVSVLFGGAPGRSVRLRRSVLSRQPALRVRRAAGGVGVVQFNVFTEEMAAQFLRALKGELRGARGLVIDLRDNGGGDAEAMTDIASLVLPPGLGLGRFTDRAGRVRLEPHTRSRLLSTAESPVSFGGPVVVLTGGRTASASEVFAAALKHEGRARVFGEGTCGCVLGIRRRHTLPDGGLLDVSEMDYRTRGGERLEGAGVSPDETIAPTRRDLREGRDPALERALEFLRAVRKN